MAENYELISAKDLPTTDAKEVDVVCVEGGELKRKPGASIGGGGGYVVRLPADTQMQMDESGGMIMFIVEESRDNFAEILYNGGSVLIDASATPFASEMGNGFAIFNPIAWTVQEGALMAMWIFSGGSGNDLAFMFSFPNGTWTPPTAE